MTPLSSILKMHSMMWLCVMEEDASVRRRDAAGNRALGLPRRSSQDCKP